MPSQETGARDLLAGGWGRDGVCLLKLQGWHYQSSKS